MSVVKRRARKEREKGARKVEILRAAVGVFSRNGFVKTSMELIADEAELAVGTVYRYYSSKEELYVSVVVDAISSMNAGLEEIAASNLPPIEKLEQFWNYFLRFYKETPMYFQAFQSLQDPSFSGALSPAAHESVKRFSTKNFRVLADIVQDGIDAGSFYPDNPHSVADLLWASFVGLISLAETRKRFDSSHDDLENMHPAMWAKLKRSILVEVRPMGETG